MSEQDYDKLERHTYRAVAFLVALIVSILLYIFDITGALPSALGAFLFLILARAEIKKSNKYFKPKN